MNVTQHIHRLTIEKNGACERGLLIRFEGEVMEVHVKNPRDYRMLETVQCEYMGHPFESKVLKVADSNLYLFVPLYLIKEVNRRKEYRVKTDFEGQLYLVVKKEVPTIVTIDVQLIDLSVQGLGFMSQQFLTIRDIYPVFFQTVEGVVHLKAKIRNEVEQGNGIRYGASIEYISPEYFHVLRKFVLCHQLKI